MYIITIIIITCSGKCCSLVYASHAVMNCFLPGLGVTVLIVALSALGVTVVNAAI